MPVMLNKHSGHLGVNAFYHALNNKEAAEFAASWYVDSAEPSLTVGLLPRCR
jgi:hypothetical protein